MMAINPSMSFSPMVLVDTQIYPRYMLHSIFAWVARFFSGMIWMLPIIMMMGYNHIHILVASARLIYGITRCRITLGAYKRYVGGVDVSAMLVV